jgi:uncharacterized protein YjcR
LAKADILGPEAERLYVIEQCSLAEIASRLMVAERTVRNWKEKAGDWEDKRRAYLGSRQSFHEELYEFARELLKKVREDMAEGKEVSANRLYALMRLIPNLVKVKDYEAVAVSKRTETAGGPITAEELAKIIDQQLCGHG